MPSADERHAGRGAGRGEAQGDGQSACSGGAAERHRRLLELERRLRELARRPTRARGRNIST